MRCPDCGDVVLTHFGADPDHRGECRNCGRRLTLAECSPEPAREEAGGANATRFAGQCWGGSDTPDERAREEAGDE